MKTSDNTDKISEALAAAQGMMRNPEKNKTAKIPMKAGGTYSYDYADLPATIDTIRPALAKNGLAHVAGVKREDRGTVLAVRLLHTSGQWLESEMDLPMAADPKAAASNLTYFRRYLLTALVGIAADDDLDSEPEAGATYEQRRKQAPLQTSGALDSRPRGPAEKTKKPVKTEPRAKPTNPLDYVPQIGKWITTRLGDHSATELEEYATALTRSLHESGKRIEDLPTLQRELYENLMAATLAKISDEADVP